MALENINVNKPTAKTTVSESNKSRPGTNARAEKNFRKALTGIDADSEDISDSEEVDEGSDEKKSLFDLSAAKKPIATKAPSTQRPIYNEAGVEVDPDDLKSMAEKKGAPQAPKANTGIIPGEEVAAGEDVTEEVGEEEKSTIAQTPKQMPGTDKSDYSMDEAGRMTTAMNVNKKGKADGGYAVETEASEIGPKKAKLSSNSQRTEFSEENPDLAAVNANRQSVAPLLADKPGINEEATNESSIRDLASKLIEKIQTMRSEGKNETIVTLRSPPILEGSVITLSSLDVAKREFNISFTSLTEAGKMFLDSKLAGDSLTQILERKGIVVHALTTTTLAELPIATDADNKFGRDQQREEQQKQQQRQQQTFEDEETV